jgi:hypothetical protein
MFDGELSAAVLCRGEFWREGFVKKPVTRMRERKKEAGKRKLV